MNLEYSGLEVFVESEVDSFVEIGCSWASLERIEATCFVGDER